MRDMARKPREPVHMVNQDTLGLYPGNQDTDRPHVLHIFYIAKIFYSLPVLTMLSVYWSTTKNGPIMQQDDRKENKSPSVACYPSLPTKVSFSS